MNRREHGEAARRACAARWDSDREQIAERRESGLRDALELLAAPVSIWEGVT